jgi:hypothetical protein
MRAPMRFNAEPASDVSRETWMRRTPAPSNVGIGTSERLTPEQVRHTADRVRVLMRADKDKGSAEYWAKRRGLAGVALRQVLGAIDEDEA